KTLAGIAHGLSQNLIERAADVMLKERRRLIVVPRETPMSLPDLRNMVLAAEAGAMLLPAMPAFYQKPATLDDLGAFIAGKILGALGFDHDLFPAWGGSWADRHGIPRRSRGCSTPLRAGTTRSTTCSAPASIAGGGAAPSAPCG